MTKLSESKSVESKVTEWLSQMGWKYCSVEDLKQYKRPQTNVIIEKILIEKVMTLNNINQQTAEVAVDTLLNNLLNPIPIEGNERFLSQLIDGVTITINDKDCTIRFINLENIWDNSFIVTNQYVVQQVRVDICLLVRQRQHLVISYSKCAIMATISSLKNVESPLRASFHFLLKCPVRQLDH